MTEEEVANLGESDPEGGGAKAVAQPDVLPAKDAQHSLDAENLVEALRTNPEFKSLVESYFQPWKDRRLDKHEKRLDGFESQLAEFEALKKEGWTDAQAKRLMKLGQQSLEEQEPVSPPASPAKTEVVTGSFDADSFLKAQGIDPNSAEAVELVRKGAKAEDYFNFVIERKTKPVKPPSTASSMPEGVGASVPSRTYEVVAAEVNAVANDPKGVDFAKMKELEGELRTLVPKK